MIDQSVKVLVVDDEEELAAFLAKSIAKNNILTKTCNNGREAVAFLKAEKVDAILTDMRMPIMDGLELIYWVRDNLEKQPPIFVLTGYADENKTALIAASPTGVFQKPADIKKCVQAVTEAAQAAFQKK